jgi:cytochrome c oxidase subunit I
VTAVAELPGAAPVAAVPPRAGLVTWLTTTDHKRVAVLYLVTAAAFFALGGALALAMRTELARPGLQVLEVDQYHQFFTMHGSIMMFLFATPVVSGLANFLVPLQVGAADMAFPRANALSYWLFLGGGLTMLAGFASAGGAAAFGWTAYAPLSDAANSPGVGPDLWIAGLMVTGIGTILTAVNIVTTVICLRAPGMTMFRLPILTWTLLVTAVLMLIAFPVLTAALAMLWADRELGAAFFEPDAGGSAILWQHLFWFFGHPEVYIVALPFFGVVSEIIPVFSGTPLFGYRGFVLATLLIAAYSVAVWAHHMFTTGAVELGYFSGMTFLIAIPTGVKVFNWLGTMWGGRVRFSAPMCFALAFLVTFVIGGLSGPMLASTPFDRHVHDTYFVVAHMHYVLFSTTVFAGIGALYFWWPKCFGWCLGEVLGRWQAGLTFVGFHLTFFPHHVLGLDGMPRRVPDYPESTGWSGLNLLSTVGSWLTAVAMLLMVVNVVRSARRRTPAGDDPWGAHSLEWTTSSPPPPHNFDAMVRIRSEHPALDARLARRAAAAAATGRGTDPT